MAEGEVNAEKWCLENKQSAAASASSVSEGSGSVSLKSSGVSSPTATSPLHRRTTGPIRRAKGGWTPEEDETLRNAVATFKGKSWKKIAEFFPDRSEVQCLHRWQKVLNPELVKGPWTQQEDEKIIELVAKYGPTKWSVIAKSLPGRIGKQCRERWHNHLNPDIKKDAWTLEEELALINAHRIHGNKWAEIAKVLPGSIRANSLPQCVGYVRTYCAVSTALPVQQGKTDNAIKNHWNSSLKKKLDFYYATGKLPPVAKSNLQNNADRLTSSGGMEVCSNEQSDPSAETISGATDFSRQEEAKTQLDFSSKIQKTGASSLPPDDSTYSQVAERPPCIDCSCGNRSSFPIVDNCRSNDRVNQSKVANTPIRPVYPTYGSLCYEPSQLGSLSPSESNLVNTSVQPDCSSAPSTSQVGFFTPPCVKSNGFSVHSPESVLRIAARTFPNTPSIIRKRKAEVQALPEKDGKPDEDPTEKRCLSSTEQHAVGTGIDEAEHHEGTFPTPSHSSVASEFCSGKPFIASPPYRLRSKRTAIVKSIEKQLEFTLDRDKVETDTKSMAQQFKENTPVREDMSHLNMGVT
ncbi:hypothetical protein Cgig2_033210 [Carnegiea gigantea]|uniref:Uncharacterized protein n=1 Tax=Carnegiea gigantea TaxID=171969 RepID=A0A9Q1GIK4_9CARY|nr:hypothetical protein Cgig2_033210 [Carnegiea gigantea]